MEAYRLELKGGEARRLTSTGGLDPASVTMLPNERDFCYLNGGTLFSGRMNPGESAEVYRAAEGVRIERGLGITRGGDYALLVERHGTGGAMRDLLRYVRLRNGEARTLAEFAATSEYEAGIRVPTAGRDGVLFRRDGVEAGAGNNGSGVGGGAGSLWFVRFAGGDARRLMVAPGETGPARWSPDGRRVLYLNYPAEPGRLHNLREIDPATGEDTLLADTTQFVGFDRNRDASVFAGASGSLASPYVLLLLRATGREFTLCEHRASDPQMVAPVFSPDSQRIFFTSDQHGKPAIYQVNVDAFVEETVAVEEAR